MKSKSEIITAILAAATKLRMVELSPSFEDLDDDGATMSLLQRRLPDTDLITCEDLRYLQVDCCEVCHTFDPEDRTRRRETS